MDATYTPTQRRIEIISILIFLALTTFHFNHLAQSAHTAHLWSAAVGGMIASLFLSDFVSGLVHWAADTWGSPSWPVVGASLIRPFREHHVDPQSICRHDFIETNGNNCIVSLPVLMGLGFLHHPVTPLQVFSYSLTLGLTTWIFLTNQFHKWSHEDHVSPFIAALQRFHLALSVDHHHHHHVYPFTKNYCITNGWMNPILNHIGFFPKLERLITWTTGTQPRASDLEIVEANASIRAAGPDSASARFRPVPGDDQEFIPLPSQEV